MTGTNASDTASPSNTAEMDTSVSTRLFEAACELFPGGVNSPVRAFRSVEGNPVFIDSGKGSKLTDADGNTYIDFCCSWGPLLHGHAHPAVLEAVTRTMAKGTSFGAPTALENQLAELIISNNKYVDKLRFVSSGTEAVMSAIRLARGYTGRDKIVKFEGCYHGHADSLLVKAGSGLVTLGTSSSAGVPAGCVAETLVLPLASREALEDVFRKYPDEIACVIIEPVPANNGLLLQEPSYLQFLREITEQHGTLLLFDEVISGFRLGFEGAAGHYNIRPDLVTYGKVIGGGFPVGAFGGSNKMMGCMAPEGPVYQAGTLSGNPVAMAAGIAQLTLCLDKGIYENLAAKTSNLCNRMQQHADQMGYPVKIFRIGSIFWLALTRSEAIRSASEIDPETMKTFGHMHRRLLEKGVYLGPSGYEVCFVSTVHTDDDLARAGQIFCDVMDETWGIQPAKSH
ncbi:MAG: glutamate-1-semialdehyde 2,1-aminomutase [Flavobacteriales bacterium]|nr:glutamate-1-semialdehyde 2,1-aminomutase [Flavobacteriales bacterium]MCB9449138.1 glutamate-1-semialdehyde 2,1-aminomutase [Flavobacteriales bacterium]